MTSEEDFPVVGVGASAGGVEALEGFFRGVPDQPGVAFVIVTHLSPERESLLHQIVARYTKLPVHIAADGKRVEADSVYVLPADAILGMENGVLQIRPQNSSQRERKPIDVFFSALAHDRGELCAGVVLSGSDSDGTLGVKAIKEAGGITLAQVADGFGPRHSDMPDSAISTGLIDFAVPVEDMGAKIADFAHSAYLRDDGAGDTLTGADRHKLDAASKKIYEILRNQLDHDFSGYKTKTFIRRVQRRMQVTHIDDVDGYVAHLQQNPQEVGALFRDLLISVTNFFRDAASFDCLAALVIPKLFEDRGPEDIVRIWVPGCATGEEVYSLGMLLREYMDGLDVAPRVQIFATDIDERALGVARAARYPGQLLDSVSFERRARFFIPDGGSFVVAKEVRDLCIFSPHSVIRDPPFSRMDLVSCRNLLIYFGLDVQHQVIPTFHYALRPNGYLFLGTSESVSQFDEMFTSVEKKHRIFRRRSDVGAPVRLPMMVSTRGPGGKAIDPIQRRPQLGVAALRHMVDSHVLERFAPPHVVVNGEGDVVYYSARTGKYLEAAHGSPTRQIFTLARKGLRLELRTLFREAVESGRAISRDSLAVEEDDGRVQLINLTVEPLANRDDGEPMFLILFTDQGPMLSREEALNRAHVSRDGAALQIEQELRETRERLQSMIEEYETALEELKSSNEELVSVNEELQSANEELEASKEELVSLNEELHTVNSELNGKVDALDRANNDLQNLFDSTAVATVFLDRDLTIRSFTPAMMEVFNIRPTDRGRPITDLASRLELPTFKDDIAAAFAMHEVIERRIESDEGGSNYLVRLAPYRNGSQRTDGVVVTFVNVTNLTRYESRQRVLIAELQHRTRNLLTVVYSIARQTLAKDAGIEAFGSRLAALGRLQGLIGSVADTGIDLTEIVKLELQALDGSVSGRVTTSGPVVLLDLDAMQMFALALHELATNAIKYGALKEGSGKLDIVWRIDADDSGHRSLVLDWRESGLAEAPDSTRRGYGRQLIERALGFSLRAKTQLSFGTDGVWCHIEMPLASAQQASLSDA